MKKLHASGEDYLEAVLVLQKEKGMVRSVDVAQHPGWLFTQEQIYEAVWHEFPEHCGAAVTNIISQLRRKMGPDNPIHTVPHSGYKFELPPANQVLGKGKVQQSVQIDCRLRERK